MRSWLPSSSSIPRKRIPPINFAVESFLSGSSDVVVVMAVEVVVEVAVDVGVVAEIVVVVVVVVNSVENDSFFSAFQPDPKQMSSPL